MEVFRACGDRTDDVFYHGFNRDPLAFDTRRRERLVVEEDVDFAFPPIPRLNITRFSNGNWSTLYTALEFDTAIHEVAHHFREEYIRIGLPKEKYKIGKKLLYKIKINTVKQKDVPTDGKYQHPTDYNPCWDFAKNAISEGCCSLKALSVRKKNGTCIPIFNKSILDISTSIESRFNIRWYVKENRMYHYLNKDKSEIIIWK